MTRDEWASIIMEQRKINEKLLNYAIILTNQTGELLKAVDQNLSILERMLRENKEEQEEIYD